MREDNIAFKKKLHAAKQRAARRLQLQWGCTLLALMAGLVVLYTRHIN